MYNTIKNVQYLHMTSTKQMYNLRSRSIKTCLERNPLAFHPKIGKTFQGPEGVPDTRHHSKGCHCKRSGCLKNYCKCCVLSMFVSLEFFCS